MDWELKFRVQELIAVYGPLQLFVFANGYT